ncbi:MAG: DUF4290 domain-containing protein [Bacteroidales bacterium]
MNYNTQREKLIIPEYGRHIQGMVKQVAAIEDREKRNEQIRAVIEVMASLTPHYKDSEEFKHKLWDHVHLISDFSLDVDSPYPVPSKESFFAEPVQIPLEKSLLKAAHYGRNIQNMIEMIAQKEDPQVKEKMVIVLANYMRQQYLIWNKESVTDRTIFDDIDRLSDGKIVIGEEVKLSPLAAQPVAAGADLDQMQLFGPGGSHNQSGRQSHRPNYRGGRKRSVRRRS